MLTFELPLIKQLNLELIRSYFKMKNLTKYEGILFIADNY